MGGFLKIMLIGGLATLAVVYGVALVRHARDEGRVDVDVAARQVQAAVIQSLDDVVSLVSDSLEGKPSPPEYRPAEPEPEIEDVLTMAAVDTSRVARATGEAVRVERLVIPELDPIRPVETLNVVEGLLRAYDELEVKR